MVTNASARDHGLRRVRGITGWLCALAALGSIMLAGGYAVAMPGKSYSRVASTKTSSGQTAFGQPVAAPTTPAAAGTRRTAAAGPPHATSSHRRARALQPPSQAPAPAQAPPQTVSGAS